MRAPGMRRAAPGGAALEKPEPARVVAPRATRGLERGPFLSPSLRLLALEVRDEGVVFGSDAAAAHPRRDGEFNFHARELESVDDAAGIVMRWHDEDRAAGALQ
jgi:hypothetical protein